MDGNLRLAEFDNDFEIKWLSQDDRINNFIIFEDDIIYTVYRTKTVSLNLTDFTINYEVREPITIFKSSLDKPFYYDYDRDSFFKFDLKKGKMLRVSSNKKLNGLIKIIGDCQIHYQSGSINLYNKTDFSLLWQKNLSEIASYTNWDGEHKGEVNNVYSYKDKIIVVAGDSILALEMNNGKIQWQTTYNDFQPYTLHIVKNIGYLCRGAYYSLIDLDTGEKLLEVMLLRPFDLNSKHKSANVAMVRSDMTYHEGYFYFTDTHEGQSYLGKIESQTGVVEGYQILEGINSNIHPPKFHDDKMFLLDSESNLHIYKKD